MELFSVDESLCNKDGLCAMVCPMAIIRPPSKEAFPGPAPNADEACIRCGHCVAVCPTAAFSHRDMPVEGCPPIKKELKISAEQAEQFIRSRRSVREFTDKPVTRDEAARLIDIARYAQSGHNSQPVSWLVVLDQEKVKALAAHVIDWCKSVMKSHPDFAKTMHMDIMTMAWDFGFDAILRGAPALVAACGEKGSTMAPDACVIATTTMELAAPSLGLGTCWAGYFIAASRLWKPLKEAMQLPEKHEIFGAVMLGHPKFKYSRMPARKAPVIHWR
ncbi:MAG: nitroreductase family protein [Deltaproteobacteria bacterium]|nr:nitroreductase family protein [Deltaproteobacteria bacterium]